MHHVCCVALEKRSRQTEKYACERFSSDALQSWHLPASRYNLCEKCGLKKIVKLLDWQEKIRYVSHFCGPRTATQNFNR